MLLNQVQRTIDRNGLLRHGDRVIVGVSGGPDSLCLLHVLCRLRSRYELQLHVAHLHHGLRGADADGDAEFVRTQAEDWGLAYTVERADVLALARDRRLAVEEAARHARYGFLTRLAATLGARTIAVGHNADDQAETVLMHWLRGSGLAGLRGMLPRILMTEYRLADPEGIGGERESLTFQPSSGDLCLIRPLLEVTRTDVEAYCASFGLVPRFDRSNLDTTYYRNWLRHAVLPLLAQHNPGVLEVIRRSARVAADDYALLRELLDQAWPGVVLEETDRAVVFDLEAWRALPTSLQRSTLREAIHRLRRSLRNINFVHVENALLVARDGTTGNQATLPQGLMLAVEYNRFSVGDVAGGKAWPDWPLLPAGSEPLPVALPGVTALPDSEWSLVAELQDRADLRPGWENNRDPWLALVDAQAKVGEYRLRTRRPGDRFTPLGFGGHVVKLGDFLTNRKVPRAIRDRLPLVVDEAGIAWVCGQRADERTRVSGATTGVVTLRFAR